VAIVSKTLAERLWPDQGALGRQVRLGEVVAEVIGVAADTRYRTVLAAPPPLLYSPLTQNYDSIGRLMVAFAGPAAGFREALRREVQRANAELPIRGAATLAEQIEASLWERSAAASLLSFFGALAIVLACAGIYGVVAYATARQTREIAIRMALGARRSAVLGGVIARTVRLAAFGIVLGLPLAIWSRPALATILDGVRGAEPLAFGGVVLLFLVVAAAAAALPARRAASIDPALALKAE
jgi:predicted lysophospholipase L1 biosynthesis ABC-type transport system permease subunit